MIDIYPEPICDINMGRFREAMTPVIEANVVDTHFRELLIPNFSNTTDNNTSVAAIAM